MALVTLSDISISYGGDPVLAGVDFQIEPGERIALVGRNGSGKSTLPKFLAGRIDHELGEVVGVGSLQDVDRSFRLELSFLEVYSRANEMQPS